MISQGRSKLSSLSWNLLAAAAWVILAMSLLATAVLAQSAWAAAPSTAVRAETLSFPEFFGDESGWEDEGEWEDEEEESEDDEDDEIGSEGALLLPPDCLLRTAEAQVAASPAHDTVNLTIRYTSSIPTKVSVDYWLKGGKGSLQLDSTTRHVTQQGVIRIDEHLGEHAMAKVRAAHTFVVQLGIPAAPAYCSRYSTQRLTVRRMVGGRATWSRPN